MGPNVVSTLDKDQLVNGIKAKLPSALYVEVTSVVRSSGDSFDVRWREQAYENGTLAGTTRYTAVLSIVLQRPRTEEALRKNPLGIYVHALNWSRDLISGDNQ